MNEETIVIIQKECKDGKHMVVLSPPGTWLGDPKATCGYRCVCGKHAVIMNAPPDPHIHNPEEPIPIYGELGTTAPSPLALDCMQKAAHVRESYSGVEPLSEDAVHVADQMGEHPQYTGLLDPAEEACAELAAKGYRVPFDPTPEPTGADKGEQEAKP